MAAGVAGRWRASRMVRSGLEKRLTSLQADRKRNTSDPHECAGHPGDVRFACRSGSVTARANDPTFRIGKVAARLGVTTRTIRYYEELGLLGGGGAARTKGAHRLYGEADIAHLQQVLRLRDLLGLSLESIVDLAQAEEMRAALRSEWEQDPSNADRLRIIAEAMPLIERQLELVKARQKTLSKFGGELRGRLNRMHELRAEIEAKSGA
jgi:DNA-binding transcriptional MerR regulator